MRIHTLLHLGHRHTFRTVTLHSQTIKSGIRYLIMTHKQVHISLVELPQLFIKTELCNWNSKCTVGGIWERHNFAVNAGKSKTQCPCRDLKKSTTNLPRVEFPCSKFRTNWKGFPKICDGNYRHRQKPFGSLVHCEETKKKATLEISDTKTEFQSRGRRGLFCIAVGGSEMVSFYLCDLWNCIKVGGQNATKQALGSPRRPGNGGPVLYAAAL